MATRVLQLRTEQRQRRSQLMRGMRNEAPLHGGLPLDPRNALIDRIHNGPQLALKVLRAQRHKFVRRTVAHVIGQRHQVPQLERQPDAYQHDGIAMISAKCCSCGRHNSVAKASRSSSVRPTETRMRLLSPESYIGRMMETARTG